MRTFLKILLLTFFMSLVACKGQAKNTMIEKFDFEVYKKTEYGENRYLKNDGFEIIEMAFIKDKKGFQREFEPKPSFKKIYKRFYGNGNLNSKETYIGENVKIGISEYYNEDGTLDKKVNEDEKFGKIKYSDCLTFLDKKGYIDLKTGKGRENENQSPVFELDYSESDNMWYITVVEGKVIKTPPDNSIGEPSGWLPIVFKMDGETGKVTEEK
ncbi:MULTISPECIES: hypothetical protein [Flavobacterium]|uniref:Lipoprotein n=1 Tax=Flavobacterium columnare TaxID=996 RepID=A0AA94F4G0_9FLAO|nr:MULTISPECIES: hypothetical protein [Flavobacterium]MCH4830228.1 hypothetical protein [Flavobacterium columnare]MCH4832389.1 hypothetical protein [Flavobacterium columnare]